MSNHKKGPIKPVAPYLGGKSRLAKCINSHIQAIPHTTYCEPFVGMGGVFLRRSEGAKAEVINDINRDIWVLFRVLQEHYAYFIDYMRFTLASRAEFERLVDVDPNTLTDIQRAARFLYLQRTAFGGKPSGRNFGVSVDRASRFDITKLTPMLEDLHTRLAGTVIECLHYEAFIKRYDCPGTLFYLDPPYYNCEGDYGKDVFTRDDFTVLSTLLKGLSGRFIMSLNDVPEVREIFSGFKIDAVKTTYSIARKSAKRVGEVPIMNTY